METYETPCRGFVTIGYRNKKTGTFSPIHHQKNLVMYGAADIMARLVSGDMRYAISHMYYHYQNTNSNLSINPITDRSQGRSSSDLSMQKQWDPLQKTGSEFQLLLLQK